MEKEFIPYSLALRMKALGFDEPCFGYYIELVNPIQGILTIEKCDTAIDGCLAPTYSQAFRWFKEEYFLSSNIIEMMYDGKRTTHFFISELKTDNLYFKTIPSKSFTNYKEAELECLQKLIETVEKLKVDEG